VETEHIYARGNHQLFDLPRCAETRDPHRQRREVSVDMRYLPQTPVVDSEHIHARVNVQLLGLSWRAEACYPYRERA
jgi:hypothetical protein